MEPSGDRYDKERQEHKLRPLEVELTPFYQTLKHQPEKSSQLRVKALIFAGKLLGLGVATVILVNVALVLANLMLLGLIVWFAYKIFVKSKNRV